MPLEDNGPVEVGPEPLPRKSVWPQILVVFLLAVLAQAIGLMFAYVERCKPGQGNDWCGAASVGSAIFGFAAAFCIVVVGTIVIFLRRRSGRGGGKVGVVRVLAVTLGVILVVPCAWMLGIGWSRNHGDSGLWSGLVVGLALILVAFVRRRRPAKDS